MSVSKTKKIRHFSFWKLVYYTGAKGHRVIARGSNPQRILEHIVGNWWWCIQEHHYRKNVNVKRKHGRRP